nr:porin [Pontibacter liquoris]
MLLFLYFSFSAAQAQSVNSSKFGKGLQFVAADSSFSFKMSTRFQLLYAGNADEGSSQWNDGFQVRRARLKFEGFAYNPALTYKIELGLSNRDIGGEPLKQQSFASNIVLDAVARWQATPHLSVWVGQTKLPGNRERVVSSQKMQFVDRSLLNSRFNLDRDMGVQLHHEHEVGTVVLREIGSVAMGEGRNITSNNTGGYNYTARFEVLPFGEFEGEGDYVGSDLVREQTPKLSLAASYNYNDGAIREQGQLGDFLSAPRDLQTVFIDGMFKYRGFSSMAEYATSKAYDGPVVSRNADGSVNEAFVTGQAFNVQAGYLLKTNWEVAGRYTSYNPAAATMRSSEKQYTLGLSKYIVGHSLKVQSDLTLTDVPAEDNNYQFRLQLELAL